MRNVSKTLLVVLGVAFYVYAQPGSETPRFATMPNDERKMNPIEDGSASRSSPLTPERRKRALPTGLWGGQHISFNVSGKSTKVEYDCAHGTINQAITLDSNGRFNVSGTHFQERGGPVRQGEQSGYPVTFSGEVKGKTMTLTVRNAATKEVIGTFTLVHGAQPKLVKCL
jgi:hypothetical protein